MTDNEMAGEGAPDAEPRLRHMGPLPGGGFGMELEGGPLHAFAAHLIDLMTGPNGKLWNCMETEVIASDGRGAFTLTVQNRNGKTPMQIRKEAEVLLRYALDAIETGRSEPLFAARDAIRNYFRDSAAIAQPSIAKTSGAEG